MSATDDPSIPLPTTGPAASGYDSRAGDDGLRQLITYLVDGEPDGMDCRDLLDIIARYVDLEALGGTPDAWMPAVNGHLGACDHCQDLHEVLLLLALRDEALGPDLAEIWERVREQAGVTVPDTARG